jgi:hypothetical protein
LRVCEDICRFFHNKTNLTREYKSVRHQLTAVFSKRYMAKLLGARNVGRDVGKTSTAAEFKRKDVADIFYANSQRAKESVRVLEELAKLFDQRSAQDFKVLRYKLYILEQQALKEF